MSSVARLFGKKVAFDFESLAQTIENAYYDPDYLEVLFDEIAAIAEEHGRADIARKARVLGSSEAPSYESLKEAGFNKGYDEGHKDGKEEGKQEAENEADERDETPVEEAVRAGYGKGYDKGYTAGRREGLEEALTAVRSLS